MKKITLKFDKSKRREYAVDIKEFFEKYQVKKDSISSGYKMLIGTPVLLNIEGTYITMENACKICKSSGPVVSQYFLSLKHPECDESTDIYYNLIWA